MVRLHVVSDVHGATAKLATADEGSDALLCLGDLLLYLDYDDPSQGAFAQVYGEQTAQAYIALRLAKRFDEARALTRQVWQQRYGGSDAERMTMLMEIVSGQYREIFTAMPAGTYFTYGNVDVPAIGETYRRADQHYVDASVVDINGWRVGFVGGGLHSPYRTPNELTESDFAAKVDAIDGVDILCSHVPPRIADLRYDVVARRFEVGSSALLDLIRQAQPRFALFGHVHNPLARRFRVGRTECINVGHFRSLRRPFVLDLPDRR